MLTHLNTKPQKPDRVVILGAAGFVGKNLCRKLKQDGVDILALGHAECDLENPSSTDFLFKTLKDTDSLVIISAKAPVKNTEMLLQNIRMMKTVCDALKQKPVAHVLYVSSDAVYADSERPLCEESCAQPASLHGVMHLAREVMLKNEWTGPLAFLRPTLIYGEDDPHNGYGPNKFARLAKSNGEIVLFGEGEERRDHVWVDDVAELAKRILFYKSTGVLNAATGQVVSFKQTAEGVVKAFNAKSGIRGTPRKGSMPHNGYRPFDAAQTKQAFPDFHYTSFEKGVEFLKNIKPFAEKKS
jgi:nucleoside-diphosphate-sugar epimerase